jgi:hypothetical protein
MSTMTKCPNCSKVLKLKSEAAFGKKVACPQCQEPFTVKPFKKKAKAKPAVKEPEDEYDDYGDANDDYGDTYDDYGDTYDDYGGSDDDQQDDYEAAPKRSGSSKSSKKKKKKKKAAGLPPWLTYVAFGLAGVLVLGGLAGVVVMAVGSMGGNNAMDLAWLPGDADLFVKVEPDELWNSPMLKTVRESEVVKTMMDQATTNGAIKLEPADIDSVTLAGVDMIDMYQQRVGFLGGNVGGPQLAKKADAKMIGVVRLKKDVTEADLGDDAVSRKQEYNGKTYYTSPGNQAMYLADPRTMIVGAEEEVKKAIDRGPAEPRVKRIDFANVSHQLVIVMAPPKLLDAEARAKVQPTSGTASQQKLGKALDQNSKAFCFGLSLKTNIEMEVQLQCFGSEEAEALKTELDTMLAEVKNQFTSSTGQLPPQMADFVAIGKETIDSLSTTKSGDEIILAARVPGRITTVVQDAIASNPMAGMMLQGMTQQFNQGATTPGIGAPGAGVNSLNPDPAQAGLPPAGDPENFEAGVRQDQQNTLDTIGGIRSRIKSTTGSIQDAVPGGK